MVKIALFTWLISAAALPAQNLFTWNGWARLAPQWQVNYTVTQQRITFNPFCPPPCGIRPRTGVVVVFQDQSQSGFITHRISSVNPDGSYVTKGDASRESDSTPLHPDNVVGVGQQLVPFAGYPVVWRLTDSWFQIAASLVALVASVWMARWAFHHDPWGAASQKVVDQEPRAATTVGVVLLLVVGVPDSGSVRRISLRC